MSRPSGDPNKANDRYCGVETEGPRLLVAVAPEAVAMLDLSDSAIRGSLGVTLKELAAEGWRKLLQAGRTVSPLPPVSQNRMH